MWQRRVPRVPIIALILGAILCVGAWGIQWLPRDANVPTLRVVRSDLDTSVSVVGEVRATRITVLSALPAGGPLRLLMLKPTGAWVARGDIVMMFDPADQATTLVDQRAELREAELEIRKLKADAAVQAARDKGSLRTARFDVRRAELDMRANAFLSRIKVRQNELSLEEARRQLAQLETDTSSHVMISKATMAALVERREKARLAKEQTEHLIKAFAVRAPMAGIVSVAGNRDGTTYSYTGAMLPEYREGDAVTSGSPVMELLDVGQMELLARVPDTERSNLSRGLRATVTVDGWPTAPVTARVKSIGAIRTAGKALNRSDSAARFLDVSLTFDTPLPDARPGMAVHIRILCVPLRQALAVPRHAIFERDGKAIVYVKVGARFEARILKVTRQTESAVIVTDLEEGVEIALVDPVRKPG